MGTPSSTSKFDQLQYLTLPPCAASRDPRRWYLLTPGPTLGQWCTSPVRRDPHFAMIWYGSTFQGSNVPPFPFTTRTVEEPMITTCSLSLPFYHLCHGLPSLVLLCKASSSTSYTCVVSGKAAVGHNETQAGVIQTHKLSLHEQSTHQLRLAHVGTMTGSYDTKG